MSNYSKSSYPGGSYYNPSHGSSAYPPSPAWSDGSSFGSDAGGHARPPPPGAPLLRSIPLPLNISPAGSSRNTHGLHTPPTSPHLALHPLLESVSRGPTIAYDVKYPPVLQPRPTLRIDNYSPNGLYEPATRPSSRSLPLPIKVYANGHQLNWQIRVDHPNGAVLTVIDVLLCIHANLNTLVTQGEMTQISPAEVESARQAHARRVQVDGNRTHPGVIRRDFLLGATAFGGISSANGCFVLRLVRA
ncbi:hypothetical protein BD410DRAFT_321582 [Rickenella mellea]|uniref:DUF6699 domain-containing protein n=1 Tax=Rickenella mellea TaxID=50990 RepID=A0A4Y7PZW8_9AGAM|nr:hypothetical protein BD410DRAFT_321582 [Rickenella mellea]